MDITRALQRAVKGFKLGTAAMSAAMGLRGEKTLWAKVDPNREETHASPEEMAQIMEISGDYGALYVLAAQSDHLCLKNPSPFQYEGEDCRKAIAETLARAAQVVTKAIEADADNNVTASEDAEVTAACLQLMAAANDVRAFISWRYEQSKPAHLRRVA